MYAACNATDLEHHLTFGCGSYLLLACMAVSLQSTMLHACICPMPPCLQGTAKERFNEIQQELSKLSTTFGNNVLDATKAYKRLLTGEEPHLSMQAFTFTEHSC